MSQPSAQTPTYEKRKKSSVPIIIGAVVILAVIAALIAYFVFGNRGGTPADAPKNDIVVGLVLEPTSLDVTTNAGVATSQVLMDNVYQGLVGIKSGTVADLEPVLATELPEVSADGREYTFTIHDGVTFHSGAALTVDDVVHSLTASLTPDTIGFAVTTEKLSDSKVKLTLDEPNSMLMWHLASNYGAVLETGAANNLQNSANGTGPFKFENWKQGDSLTLERFDEYWGEPASLERATFRFFPEGRAAVNALKDGDVDVHTALLPPLRAEFEGNANFSMVRAASSDVFTLAFNNAKAPFDDPRVRQALSMAIDGEALVSTQNGDALPLGGPITALEPGYENLTDVHAYDPEAARELLAEAGQQNLSLTITAPNFYDSAALDLVTSQLAEIGVSAKVNPVEFPTWLSEVYTNHDFDLSYVDHAEARDFANYTNPGYYFSYDNPEAQRLYAESLASTDEQEANHLLQQAARIVAEDAPVKWMYNYTPTNVIGKHVTGFPEANTNSRINLTGVSVG